jgi:glycosyltransferase involved in cell wall biosynthesis
MIYKSGVSIIICCHNSSSRLKPTFLHISNQKLSPHIACELIIIDNASNDGTAAAAINEWGKLNNHNIEFKVVYEPVAGLSNARKKGVLESKYNYLIFCDDDNWLSKDYANTIYDFFEAHPRVAIIGGFGEPAFDNEALVPSWFDKFSVSYALGPQAQNSNMNMTVVYGAGISVRKEFLTSSAYKQLPVLLTGRNGKISTAGDDSEICFKAKLLGYNIAYLQNLKFKHFISNDRLTWSYLKKLHTGFAESFVPINLYERALKTSDLTLPRFYWFKKMFYYTAIYLKYWPGHYKAYSKTEGTIEEINHITWRTIASSYLYYNFKTIAIYRQIIAFKSIEHQ